MTCGMDIEDDSPCVICSRFAGQCSESCKTVMSVQSIMFGECAKGAIEMSAMECASPKKVKSFIKNQCKMAFIFGAKPKRKTVAKVKSKATVEVALNDDQKEDMKEGFCDALKQEAALASGADVDTIDAECTIAPSTGRRLLSFSYDMEGTLFSAVVEEEAAGDYEDVAVLPADLRIDPVMLQESIQASAAESGITATVEAPTVAEPTEEELKTEAASEDARVTEEIAAVKTSQTALTATVSDKAGVATTAAPSTTTTVFVDFSTASHAMAPVGLAVLAPALLALLLVSRD